MTNGVDAVELTEKKIEAIRDLMRVQGAEGNYDADPYMLGMYNGMELIAAIVEGREPTYKEADFGGHELSEYEQVLVIGALSEALEGEGVNVRDIVTDAQAARVIEVMEKYEDTPQEKQIDDMKRLLIEKVTGLFPEKVAEVKSEEGDAA